jgi:sulfur-oxidizing protein SoxA
VQAELEALYRERLPGLTALHDLAHGVAALDPRVAESQAAMADFPPWELFVADGREAWTTPFPDGSGYAACFPEPPAAIRPRHPYFDEAQGEVVTLDLALDACRAVHGLAPLGRDGAEMNALVAYLAHAARDRAIAIPPPGSAAARAALADGRATFFARQGRLELACSDCHVRAVGRTLRDVTLGPAIGVAGRFPVYSLKIGALSSLQARFQGCYRVVRARPPPLQSRTLRNLEYYLNAVSQGYPITAPGLLR